MRLQWFKLTAALAAAALAFGLGALAAEKAATSSADAKGTPDTKSEAEQKGAPEVKGTSDAKPAADAKGTPDTKPAADAQAAGGPRLTIEKETVDLGEVLKGTTASAVFEIKNTGDQVLKILDARPG